MFAHGFSIHFGQVEPPFGVDVGMVALEGARAPGPAPVRGGRGVPCLMAVHQDESGNARELVLAYASGIGGGRYAASSRRRSRTSAKRTSSASSRCSAAAPPSWCAPGSRRSSRPATTRGSLYFECLHELKLIVDLMYEKGVQGMRDSISNGRSTAT